MNNELAAASVYNKLDQKNVTALVEPSQQGRARALRRVQSGASCHDAGRRARVRGARDRLKPAALAVSVAWMHHSLNPGRERYRCGYGASGHIAAATAMGQSVGVSKRREPLAAAPFHL